MSKISEKLKNKIRRQAQNRCGYCLLPQSLNPGRLEIEHLLAVANGGTDDEEIFGWRVVSVTVIKAYNRKPLTRKAAEKFGFLIPEHRIGTNILAGRKKKSSEKLPAAGQLFKL